MKNKALEALESLYKIEVIDQEGKPYNPIKWHKQEEFNTLKQALQSNVSEDIKKEYILIERSFEKWAKRDDYDYSDNLAYFSFLKLRSKLNDLVSQPHPTLEELKQSIIDRLSVIYRNVSRYEITIDGKKNIITNKNSNLGSYVVKFSQIDLDLAHDITKFFMELKR